MIRESATISGAPTPKTLAVNVHRESARIFERVTSSRRVTVTETAVMHGAPILSGTTTTLADVASIGGQPIDGASPRNSYSELAMMSGRPVPGFRNVFAESAAMSDTWTQRAIARNTYHETAGISGLPSAILRAHNVYRERAQFGDAMTDSLRAVNVYREQALISGSVVTPLAGNAWTVPTDTFAMSRYTGFAFNSVTSIGGRLLAAGAGGLFDLTGSSDAGTPIAAELKTGMSDLGSAQQKRVSEVFIGYEADGQIALAVAVPTGGTEQRYDYQFPAKAAADPVANRARPGRGLRSRYWRFTVANVAGADFKIADIRADVDSLTRKL